ncbi:MAG: hypothetical protein IKV53_00175 [Clostridia bacterium]|nr:hypothetical protein [Clostridia bacterium]
MNESIELLNALYRQSAKESRTLGVLLSSVENQSLRRDILCQICDCDGVNREAGEEITAFGEKPKNLPLKDRVSIIGANMSVNGNNSCENVARIISNASSSGARELTHIMNNCINSAPRIYSLARRYVANAEKSTERMKPYL